MKKVFQQTAEQRISSTIFQKFFQYDSRQRYLSIKRDNSRDVSRRLYFKTSRNPLFHNIQLKNLFLYHLGSDFDVTICYKATPSLAKFVSGLPSQR